MLENEIPGSQLVAFGSFSTKLYLPNADIDLVLINEQFTIMMLLKKTKDFLKKNENLFKNIEVLKSAKVPIIKFTHIESKIEFDITFNERMGLDNILEVNKALKIHPEIKYLLMIIKIYLRQRRQNITFSGGVGSFLLFNLILTFVRKYKKDTSKRNDDIESIKNITLSEYLLKFLQYFGTFDVNQNEIHMADGGSVRRKQRSSLEFCLYSPMEPGFNIGGKAFRIKEIFGSFRNRISIMTNKDYKNQDSILADLINPTGVDFSVYLYDK